MSGIIPPLLSNSPPPITEDALDDDDDDDFSDFRAAVDLSFDGDSFSMSPSPGKCEKIEDEKLDINRNEDVKIVVEQSKDNKIDIKLIENEVDLPVQISEINEQNHCDKPDITIPPLNLQEEHESEIHEDITLEAPSVQEESLPVEDPSSDDFGDFSTASEPTKTEDPSPLESNEEEGEDFGEFSQTQLSENLQETQDEDDDFGDFAEAPVQASKVQEEDFGNFANFSEVETEVETNVDLVLAKDKAGEIAAQILKDMFPENKKNEEDFTRENVEKNDRVFNELKDITETNALLYQWPKSSSQKQFLSALNIDTRNILYGPGWTGSLSRFPALEPIKPEVLTPTPITTTTTPQEPTTSMEIPSVDFNWTESGLVNPLEEDSKIIGAPSLEFSSFSLPENTEPQVLNLNLDLLEQTLQEPTKNALSLNDFDEFTSFEPPRKNEESSETWQGSVPLRETHISGGILEPEKVLQAEPSQVQVDDFDDFQIGEEMVEESSKVEEEEFTDFTSAPPVVQPLQPAIIHSNIEIKSASTSIAWPEPGGVTEEDLKKFELSYSSISKTNGDLMEIPQEKNKEKTNSFKGKITSKPEDDEWSDFVSVSHTNQSPRHLFCDRTASPDLPLSVLNLGSVQSPKKSIPVITPQGLVQTKIASNNTPKTVSPTHQNTIKQTVSSISKKTSFEDEEWSDFVSSPAPQSNGMWQNQWSGNSSNAVRNANFLRANNMENASNSNVYLKGKNNFQTKVVVQSKKSTIPSISMPDLDFVGTNKLKTSYRK